MELENTNNFDISYAGNNPVRRDIILAFLGGKLAPVLVGEKGVGP